jgi:hypothetical protein
MGLARPRGETSNLSAILETLLEWADELKVPSYYLLARRAEEIGCRYTGSSSKRGISLKQTLARCELHRAAELYPH